MKGRPRNQQPATAYDYRNHILLVQALTTGDSNHLTALCLLWDLPTATIYNFDYKATVRLLAEHCIQSTREGEA